MDKKFVLEQYDLLALTIDEVIDKGYIVKLALFLSHFWFSVIIETEGRDLVQRLQAAQKSDSSSGSSLSEQLKEQTFSSAFNFAKQHLARAILKQ